MRDQHGKREHTVHTPHPPPAFERRSALFALAVADTVIVNMWAKDVGREAGASKPLLKTILQVNLKLFAASAAHGALAPPTSNRARTSLVFAFRDRTRTPLDLLARTWDDDMGGLWASLAKPPGLETAALADFFDVHYVSLPNYEEHESEFCSEAAALAARLDTRSPTPLVPTRSPGDGRLPGAAWILAAASAWDAIASSRDLDLPSHRVMVASLRCGELAEAALAAALASDDGASLATDATDRLLSDYGARASLVAARALAAYDGDARYYDASVRDARRRDLVTATAAALRPGFDAQLSHAVAAGVASVRDALASGDGGGAPFTARAASALSAALSSFDAAAAAATMDGAGWDASTARAALTADVDIYVGRLTADGAAAAEADACARLRDALVAPAAALLDAAPPDMWPRLARLLTAAAASAADRARRGVEGYGLPAGDVDALASRVVSAGRAVLLGRAREAAATALPRAKERFADTFSRDAAGLPRQWGADADVAGAAATARAAAARLLAALAVSRLDGPTGPVAEDGADVVDAAVAALATGGAPPADVDASSATEWPPSCVPPDTVLLTPPTLRASWRALAADSAVAVQQALAARDAHRAARRGGAPLWALAAIAVLGANEAASLLRHPVWLLVLMGLFLFAKTVYSELDVDRELSAGALPAAIALSSKLVPTVKRVAARTLDSLLAAATSGVAGGVAAVGERDRGGGVEMTMRPPRPANGTLSGQGVRQRRMDDDE